MVGEAGGIGLTPCAARSCAAGTAAGEVLLYTLSSRECLLELSCASKVLTESVAVNRIVWGPEGDCFGAHIQPLPRDHMGEDVCILAPLNQIPVNGTRCRLSGHAGV